MLLALVGIAFLVGPAPARAYTEVEVTSPAALEGRVVLRGARPEPSFLPVLKNADVCGDRVPDESLVVGSSGGVAGVVVELVGVTAGKAPLAQPAVLDNRVCAFVPRVQALQVGQSLEIRNGDPILHDAHAWLGSKTVFNLGLPEWRRVSHTFDAPGLHAIDCNVLHTWMKAWVFVADHPYVTVTDEEGRFDLEEIPPGRHDLRIWHEKLGEKRRTVTLGPDQRLDLEIGLP